MRLLANLQVDIAYPFESLDRIRRDCDFVVADTANIIIEFESLDRIRRDCDPKRDIDFETSLYLNHLTGLDGIATHNLEIDIHLFEI